MIEYNIQDNKWSYEWYLPLLNKLKGLRWKLEKNHLEIYIYLSADNILKKNHWIINNILWNIYVYGEEVLWYIICIFMRRIFLETICLNIYIYTDSQNINWF